MDEHHHHGDEEPPVTGRGGFETRPDHHALHEHHMDEPLPDEAMDKATHGHDVEHHHPQDAAAEHAAHDHAAMGHGAHVDHTGHEEMFRRRFWVSLLLSIPVLVYSPMLQEWFGFTAPDFPLAEWIAPVF